MAASTIDKSKPYFPLAGGADDGWSTEDEATATCFCGAVQLSFLTASVHATNFTVYDTHLKHLRGRDNLKTYSQSRTVFFKTPGKDNTMTNYFCSTCGSLMYRVGAAFPNMSILRVGSVDDFSLHETKLRPTMEQFTKDRVAWKAPTEGTKQFVEDGLHVQ
ncbi:hypothetical protein N7510_001663 [Penicillium lagena]|uniref:uncharacterized protein n=1 Tax=Penicillium lagena TaxID=94218 RepID=UPI00253FF8CF|nr:uncharacterized protein N7510_001663 [Penicillium lagena]KAJ5625354.1 hypothetical protein N7510_001663 [Penicillium lagena]